MTVYPRNNLPSVSVPWGRTVENSISDTALGINRFKDELAGENRTKQGQSAVVGKNLESIQEAADELSARSASYFTTGNITRQISVSGPSGTILDDVTVEVPGPSDQEPRNGRLFISYTGYNSNPTNTWARLYVYFSVSNPLGELTSVGPPTLMAPDSDFFLGAPPGITESGFVTMPFVWFPVDPYWRYGPYRFDISVQANYGRFPLSGTYTTNIGIGNVRMAVIYGSRYTGNEF